MSRLLKLLPVIILGLTLSACSLFPTKKDASSSANKRQLLNVLPYDQRPFVAIFPHPTNKLITLYLDKVTNAKSLTIDLEYLSGTALKGGRTSLNLPVKLPYAQAFLLGSCSAGGKCSFDTDITTGDIKTQIEGDTEINLLKSNFTFVTGDSFTSDQKVTYSPTGKSKATLIIAQTHGYLGALSSTVTDQPVAITSTSADAITGTLTLSAPTATKAMIYDGSSYSEIPSTKDGNSLVLKLNLKPRAIQTTIIRDDLKGSSEDETLYLLGPIVPVK